MQRLPFSSASRWATVITLIVAVLAPRAADAGDIQDLPEQIYFKTFVMPGWRVTEYSLEKEGMLSRVTHLRGRLIEESRRRVTPLAWRQFKERILPLRLSEWKREYLPPKRIVDGLKWTLMFREEGLENTSTGHQAGPDAADPSKCVDMNPACGAVILDKAFEEFFATLDRTKDEG
jgi:hypothetical protein